MSDCTLTLGGQCCNDLSDLYTFITQLQDLNLHDATRQQCCTGGITVNAECECPDLDGWTDPTLTCLWDYCMSYNDLKAILAYFQINYDAKKPEEHLVGYVLALWAYLSSGGVLENALPTFAANVSAVLDTLLGLTVASYVGYHIITAAVNVDAEAMATDRYADYGTHGWLGAFMGIFQGLWVLSFLGYCAMMAIAPVKMTLDFNAAGAEQNTQLYFHTLQTVAAFVGYYTITEAKVQLFGVYDNGALNPDYGDDVKNNTALAWDLINHSFVAIAFSLVTVAVALGPFMYAEFTLDPTQFPESFQQYVLA